jgi:hypothetical protein
MMEASPGGGELVVLPLIGATAPLGVVLCECRRRLDVEEFGLAEQAADLCAVSFAAHHTTGQAAQHAEAAQALVELSSALGLQPTRQGTAELLCLAVARLVRCDGVVVWLRAPDALRPAASWGYTGDGQRALDRLALSPDTAVIAEAVLSRRIAEATLLDLPDVPLAPPGSARQSRLVLVGIGERAGNRALMSLVRSPLAGPLSDHEHRLLSGVQDQALLAFENRLLVERLERSERAMVGPPRDPARPT